MSARPGTTTLALLAVIATSAAVAAGTGLVAHPAARTAARRAARPVVGAPAPLFTTTDTRGRTEALAAHRGRWVVLEWFSHDCPFTRKQYVSGNMQALQREYTRRGVVWLSVVSSAPGRAGYTTAAEANRQAARLHAAPTAIIRDTSGAIGHLYGATNTPQMFVIDPDGVLRYAGAIDDKPTTRLEDVKTAKNYVRAALDAGLAGKPIATPRTQPYGCIVQY